MQDGDQRLRRLRMRSWRRGMKEMDLILGPFADRALAGLGPDMLDRYEALLQENDQDLYLWIVARVGGHQGAGSPPSLAPILDVVAAHVASADNFRQTTEKIGSN